MIIFVCLQVIKWIEEHGETFLLKHTGVGKSLVKAEALLKRHDEFESIAQVSLKYKISLLITLYTCCYRHGSLVLHLFFSSPVYLTVY